ncbi:MAG: phosphatidate cytidylyltransferase [Nitrospinota bacterium]|nr:phosphatidate cytidylyltransferase [Nitrospinota bacterium]
MVRTASALFLVSLTVPIVLYSPSWFFSLFVISVCSIIAYEYNQLSRKIFPEITAWDVILDVILFIFFACYTDYLLFPLLFYLTLRILMKLFFSKSLISGFLSLGGIFLGVVWVALPGISIILVERMELGRMLIVFLLILTWANDILAFLAGRGIGRKKLIPSISPNKTVEGSIAGLVGGTISGVFLFRLLSSYDFGFLSILLVSLTLSILGQLGDLCESAFKRVAQVKDSSSLIPGHGGFFDRLDSFLFAIPFLFTVFQLV